MPGVHERPHDLGEPVLGVDLARFERVEVGVRRPPERPGEPPARRERAGPRLARRDGRRVTGRSRAPRRAGRDRAERPRPTCASRGAPGTPRPAPSAAARRAPRRPRRDRRTTARARCLAGRAARGTTRAPRRRTARALPAATAGRTRRASAGRRARRRPREPAGRSAASRRWRRCRLRGAAHGGAGGSARPPAAATRAGIGGIGPAQQRHGIAEARERPRDRLLLGRVDVGKPGPARLVAPRVRRAMPSSGRHRRRDRPGSGLRAGSRGSRNEPHPSAATQSASVTRRPQASARRCERIGEVAVRHPVAVFEPSVGVDDGRQGVGLGDAAHHADDGRGDAVDRVGLVAGKVEPHGPEAA